MPNLPLITLFGNHEYSNVELILAFIVDSNIWLKRTIDVFCDKLVVTLALSNLWFFAKLSAMCRHNTSLSPWVRWGFFNAWMIHRRVLIGLTNEQKKHSPECPLRDVRKAWRIIVQYGFDRSQESLASWNCSGSRLLHSTVSVCICLLNMGFCTM